MSIAALNYPDLNGIIVILTAENILYPNRYISNKKLFAEDSQIIPKISRIPFWTKCYVKEICNKWFVEIFPKCWNRGSP